MQVQVKKWGNSASVRIPASVLAAASLRIDQIEPIAELAFDLDDLLAAMTPETFPDDNDFGAPVGDEAW